MPYATLSPPSHVYETIHYATLSPPSHVYETIRYATLSPPSHVYETIHYTTPSPPFHVYETIHYATLSPPSHVEERGILCLMLHYHHHPMLQRDPIPYHTRAALSPPSQQYTAHHYHPADCVKMGSKITMCSLVHKLYRETSLYTVFTPAL